MSYGILLWGRAAEMGLYIYSAGKSHRMRAIYNLRRRDSLRELFKEINIATVPCQYIYENIIDARMNLHLFRKNNVIHTYNIRNRDQLVQPGFRLAKVDTSSIGYCLIIHTLFIFLLWTLLTCTSFSRV